MNTQYQPAMDINRILSDDKVRSILFQSGWLPVNTSFINNYMILILTCLSGNFDVTCTIGYSVASKGTQPDLCTTS